MTFRYDYIRRPFPAALLILSALVVLGLGAVSCQQVTDPTTVISIDKSDVGKCIKLCNDIAKVSTQAEKEIHRINEFLCHKNKSCLAAEDKRHDAAVDRIEAHRLACIQECHHQGGASGGR